MNKEDVVHISKMEYWSSHCGSAVMNPTSIHENVDLILGPAQWLKGLALPWLWHRLAAAAPIRHLVWELPYASPADLKRRKKKKGILLSHKK